MKITVVGRGAVGGGLARLWQAAGHDVALVGRDGGDAAGSAVVAVAVPAPEIAAALASLSGLSGQVSVDACNDFLGRQGGFESLAHQVKSIVGGPGAKAFNINFAALYDQVAAQPRRPANLYAADADADEIVSGLIEDAGFDPVSVGDLGMARALEGFAPLARAIGQGGLGQYFYRFAPPGQL